MTLSHKTDYQIKNYGHSCGNLIPYCWKCDLFIWIYLWNWKTSSSRATYFSSPKALEKCKLNNNERKILCHEIWTFDDEIKFNGKEDNSFEKKLIFISQYIFAGKLHKDEVYLRESRK